MKNMKRLFALLSLVLLLAACGDNSRDPVIKDCRIGQVSQMGLGLGGVTVDMDLEVDIENPSRARYLVEALTANVFPAGDTVRIATVGLKEKTAIAPKSDETVSLPLDVRLLKPLTLLSGGLSQDLSDYEADIDLTIRKGSLKKTIRKKRVPLEQLAELLGSGLNNEK